MVADRRLDPRSAGANLPSMRPAARPSTSSTVTFLSRAFLSGAASARRSSVRKSLTAAGLGRPPAFALRLRSATPTPARWTCPPSPAPASAASARPAVVRAARLRRANLREPVPRRRRARLDRLVGQVAASRRRRSRWPSRTAACRSFSSAFITIQSSSPRTDGPSCRGSACRLAETVVSVSPSVLSRVLGVGGSSSRMIRRISSKAALLQRLRGRTASCRSAARRAARRGE